MKKNKTLRQLIDRVILFLIYISAAATALILVGMIGYISFRGLYRETKTVNRIIKSDNIIYKIEKEEYVLIIDKKIKRDSLDITEMENILSRDVKNWSSISESRAVVKLVSLLNHNKNINSKYEIADIKNAERFKKYLLGKSGAIGFVNPDSVKKINMKGLKILNINKQCAVAGYKVSEVINNKKLSVLDERDLERITDGEINNWKMVGGHDIKLEILETAEEVEKSEGGFAVVDYRDAVETCASIIPVRYLKKSANFTPSFLFDKPVKAGKAGGISTIILNTVFMIILTLIFSVPVGVGAAVYLTEYAEPGRVMRIIRLGVETLAGIPSILFGLFGFIFFVDILHMGIGLLSGSLTTAMMIIPVIIRTSEEALTAVPMSFREGSLALGAGLWYTVRKVVLPAAKPGILSGIILSIGRALGETAALVFTMGFDYRLANGIKSSARVLSVHLYQLVREGISFERAFATAFVLMIFIFIINTVTVAIVSGKNNNGE